MTAQKQMNAINRKRITSDGRKTIDTMVPAENAIGGNQFDSIPLLKENSIVTEFTREECLGHRNEAKTLQLQQLTGNAKQFLAFFQ